MSTPEMGDEFLKLLGRSGLLTRKQIKEAVTHNELHERPTSVDIARTFVEQGLLTRFQAKQLLQGRTHGLMLDGYKLLEPIGVGGMGWIYMAEEIETGWKVAIKVLSDNRRRDQGMLSRFQLEAQAGLRLKHPNILRTLAIHKTEDLYGEIHYVVMELVQGITLVELLWLKKKIPWRQLCDVSMQAAEALQCAHDEGLIHRDVKPENLLIRSNGATKILDFGLALLDENDEEFAMAMIHGHDRLGTADYVAPEQIIDSYQVDHRADIYSLGCTMYAGLTGRLPFPVKDVNKKLKSHLRLKAQPVQELRPDIPDRLAAIVAKMMAKHPKNRVQSAADVVRLLKPYAERESIEFNYSDIVSNRIKQATRRSEIKSSRSANDVNRQKTKDSPNGKPHSTTETVVQEDTQVEPPTFDASSTKPK